MNTDTGAIHRLHPELFDRPLEVGHRLTPRDFRKLDDQTVAKLASADLAEETVRALEAVKAGDPVVVVSAEVAHAQRLGQRELARRQRRRKARRS